MAFFYSPGEEIRKGDKVLLNGEPGEIEFVADSANDSEDWFVTEYGGGVMISEPKSFGRLFVKDTRNYEDLELVSRG